MTCPGMRSHIVDSRFFSSGYATDEVRSIFCDLHRMQRWMDIEVALAQTQAEFGIIPQAAAQELARYGQLRLLDQELIIKKLQTTSHSLMPLLFAWQQVVSEAAGQYLHFGATTQDIQDTAQSLELKDVFSIIERDCAAIIRQLIKLAGDYRSLVTVGRTHGQHALPTTMGLKFAVWLDEMLRNGERLRECKKRLLVCQMFGGVGTMAGFGEHGQQILAGVAGRLGLGKARVAWHASRDRLAEFIAVSSILAGTLANIANEVMQLSRDEIHEMEEPFHSGKLGSSTMPHKRNPELCEQVVVLKRFIKSNTMLGFDGLINEHERDHRAIRLEWISIADSSMFLCKALDLMKTILSGLIIYERRVAENVASTAELTASESLMFMLGAYIGNQKAHSLIYESAMKAHETDKSLIEVLQADETVNSLFTPEELRRAVNPENNIGQALSLTDSVINSAREWLSRMGESETMTVTCSRCGDRQLEAK